MKYEQSVQVELQEYICMVKRIDGVVAQKTLEQELIRCKDCTKFVVEEDQSYCLDMFGQCDENGFCAWAKRRKE